MLPMKALVTGGTGFIGSHLIELLLKKNVEVVALVRNLNNLKWIKGLDIHLLKGDLFSLPSLPKDIDYVFHAAGLTKATKKVDYYTVNHQGTASFFEALRSQNVSPQRIIHLSTLAAVGPSSGGKPVQETTPPQPITPYGESKLLGETEALKFKKIFPVVILRIGAIFGPRDTDFLQYFKWIKRGVLPSLASSPRRVSLCYVKDLSEALYLCSQKVLGSGEIFNIANPEPYSWDEVGKAAGQAMEKELRRVKVPLPFLYLAALLSEIGNKISRSPNIFDLNKFKDMKQTDWIADTGKAREKLSFRTQYTLQEAVKETIDWYLENNWL
ncbi:MAG: NAD(P)-dependent oxidoreductase [Candidatus Aminicenantes bacterium]|nr:MAG: NAD(P)-dependent oxidoreductase [Candidatus Aminicenantes bacterium]